jgi:hypothetical protein
LFTKIKEGNAMGINKSTGVEKGYILMFNEITDEIEELEEIMRKCKRRIQKLKKAQKDAEEHYMSEDENAD